jgi:hypothetical protein
MLDREGRLAFLDFGMIVRVDDDARAAMLSSFVHIACGDWADLADDLDAMGLIKADTSKEDVRATLERAFAKYTPAGGSSGDLSYAAVTAALAETALTHKFVLPPFYVLVGELSIRLFIHPFIHLFICPPVNHPYIHPSKPTIPSTSPISSLPCSHLPQFGRWPPWRGLPLRLTPPFSSIVLRCPPRWSCA